MRCIVTCVLVCTLFLSGCSPSPNPIEHAPLKAHLDKGNEVWQIFHKSDDKRFSNYYQFIVIEGNNVVDEFTWFTKTGTWKNREQDNTLGDVRHSYSLSGSKSADGTINWTDEHTSKGGIGSWSKEEATISSSGKYKAKITAGSSKGTKAEPLHISSSAKKISP